LFICLKDTSQGVVFQEEKAEKVMVLWSTLEKNIIAEFYININVNTIKEHLQHTSNGEYLQNIQFGDFLRVVGSFAIFFYTHKTEATHAINLIETFRGITTPNQTPIKVDVPSLGEK
jgi:hypothetical protein